MTILRGAWLVSQVSPFTSPDYGPLFAGFSYPTVRMQEQKAWTAAYTMQRIEGSLVKGLARKISAWSISVRHGFFQIRPTRVRQCTI